MNANYIYDIFETCEKNDLPDLTIALAQLKTPKPPPHAWTDKHNKEFIGDP